LKVSCVFDSQPSDYGHQQQQQQQVYASTPMALRETMPIEGEGKKNSYASPGQLKENSQIF
jgi:hypothetical protein